MSNPQEFILYGANGYTGELVAREAVKRGWRPILAGRSGQKLEPLATQLGLEYRAFKLDDQAATDEGLRGVELVLNCAGPFATTSRLLAEACLRNHCHYLDIAGEADEFVAVAALDEAAQAAGVMLMPGVGFGVVPTDCLALHLKQRLPGTTHLRLAFKTVGGVSRGTLASVLPALHKGGVVREKGVLKPARPARQTSRLDFGDLGGLPSVVVTNPWRADLVSAAYTTGIENIETVSVFPAPLRVLMRLSNFEPIGKSIASKGVQARLKKLTESQPAGPEAAERAEGRAYIWGEATDTSSGKQVVSRLATADAYDTTVLTALACVEKVLKEKVVQAGFQTPAHLFGADFILGIEGVGQWQDEPVAPDQTRPAAHLLGTEASQKIEALPDQVYDYITTPHHFPQAFKGYGPIPAMTHEVLEGETDALREGLIRWVSAKGGAVFVEKILVLERPRRYIYDIVSGIPSPLSLLVKTAHSEWTVKPRLEVGVAATDGQSQATGTILGWTYTFRTHSALTSLLALPIVKVFMKRAMQDCLGRLARSIETEVSQPKA